jgi:hypothetical protein
MLGKAPLACWACGANIGHPRLWSARSVMTTSSLGRKTLRPSELITRQVQVQRAGAIIIAARADEALRRSRHLPRLARRCWFHERPRFNNENTWRREMVRQNLLYMLSSSSSSSIAERVPDLADSCEALPLSRQVISGPDGPALLRYRKALLAGKTVLYTLPQLWLLQITRIHHLHHT